MKSIFSSIRSYFILIPLVIFSFIISCNEYSMKQNEGGSLGSENIAHDSLQVTVDSTAMTPGDNNLSVTIDTVTIAPPMDSLNHLINRNPASVSDDTLIAKGTAIVYCPAKMIKGVPSLINATISKDELSEAFTKFASKIQQKNSDKKAQNIVSDIKGDTIDLYERMGVILEFDSEDFKQISNDDIPTKAFRKKKTLEWEWVIKPLHSTRKSIINFKFYYIDPDDNSTNYILQKTISINVSVDARSYVDKWKDFLLDDPKTTTTAIVIPLFSFLGGFLTGKKKKKDP